MNRSKLFLLILGIVSFILALVALPNSLRGKEVTVPGINQKIPVGNFVSSFSDLYISLGPVRIDKVINYSLGLDLSGGTRLVYQLDMAEIPDAERAAAFESARNIIERRVNFFGVGEPVIQNLKVGDDYRIIVELPGVSDVDQAISLIGQTAQLSFWEADPAPTPQSTESAMLQPLGLSIIFASGSAQTELTGKDLQSTSVVFDPTSGTPQVQLKFTSDGSQKFADITKRNVGKPVAIVLDQQVISAPIVQQIITTGDAVISGSFTTEDAKSLSISLNAGALPVPLDVIGQTTIGPTLGERALTSTVFAGVVGFLSVVFFMIFIYKKEGVLASVALLIYVIIVLFIFKIIPITLTLAGIAGFILSIGMAIDANILIFERTREELRLGKPRDVAIRLGFSRAWTSIRDSNVSSLITTAILYYFGSGVVKGFAIALAIGILVSMFSAIIVTRNLMKAFDR